MSHFSFNNISNFVGSNRKQSFGFRLICCVSLYFLIPYQQTLADTTTTNLQVTAMVQSQCVVKNASLNFGIYDPVSTNSEQALQSVGHFDVQCVKQSTATLQLGAGNHAGNAIGTTRAMANAEGTSYLSYEIYTSPAANSVWNSNNTVSYTADSASPTTINVYGKIPANQLVTEGNYTDLVMITANF